VQQAVEQLGSRIGLQTATVFWGTWWDHLSQLLNVNAVNVRHTAIHTAERLVTELSASEFELATERLASHKSTGIDQISTELIKAAGRTIRFKIYKLNVTICYNEELSVEWKESITEPIYIKQSITEPIYIKQSIKEPIYIKQSSTEPIYIKQSITEPIYIKQSITEPIYT
jgi:hypothetical protein